MINLDNIEIGYEREALTPPLTGCFRTGSLTAVIGANGTGKSTLLKTLAGLQPALSGNMSFPSGNSPQIAYLPQQAELDKQFPIVVQDVVAMGCWPQCGLLGGLSHLSRQRIKQALESVGMVGMACRPVTELSGGQLQRVLFARVLVQQAQLILLDEPFSGIDSQTVQLLLAVIHQLHTEGRTIIAVLHDMPIVAAHFPEALWLTPQHYDWQQSAPVLARLHHSQHASCSLSPPLQQSGPQAVINL